MTGLKTCFRIQELGHRQCFSWPRIRAWPPGIQSSRCMEAAVCGQAPEGVTSTATACRFGNSRGGPGRWHERLRWRWRQQLFADAPDIHAYGNRRLRLFEAVDDADINRKLKLLGVLPFGCLQSVVADRSMRSSHGVNQNIYAQTSVTSRLPAASQ
jgi:hypothetical protein